MINPDQPLMPVHLSPFLHIECNKKQRRKVVRERRSRDGSKVGTLETFKRLQMKLSGQYPPRAPFVMGGGGDTVHKVADRFCVLMHDWGGAWR